MADPPRTLRHWVGLAERLAIHLALEEAQGDRRKAAASLGIGLRTLYAKMKVYRLLEAPDGQATPAGQS